MAIQDTYTFALYEALRDRGVNVLYSELEDALEEAESTREEALQGEPTELDPEPWGSPYHDNRSAYPEFDEAVFKPRPQYSQNRKDYK